MADRLHDKLVYGRLGPWYYRGRVLLHSGRRPALDPADEELSRTLTADALCVTSIEHLGLPEASRFRSAADRLLPALQVRAPASDPPDLTGADPSDGRNTHLHCLSVDPPELAEIAPDVLLWGVQERMLAIMATYLGLPPALTTVHVRRDFGNGRQVGTRIWHRDTEDQKVVRAVVYLTDVGDADGPFEYVPRELNHLCAPLEERAFRAAGDPVHDDEMASYVPRGRWRTATGGPGAVVIADNAALYHHGKPHSSERIAVFYTYTSRDPRYPRIRRNPRFDDRLGPRQRAAFYVDTDPPG